MDFLQRYHMPIPSDLMDKNSSGKKRILIVDDDKGVVDSILRFLKREKIRLGSGL